MGLLVKPSPNPRQIRLRVRHRVRHTENALRPHRGYIKMKQLSTDQDQDCPRHRLGSTFGKVSGLDCRLNYEDVLAKDVGGDNQRDAT